MKTAWKGVGQYTSSQDSCGNIYNNEYDLFTYGAGYLDIDAALDNTDLATGVALSPTAVPNRERNSFYRQHFLVSLRRHQCCLGCDFGCLGKLRGLGCECIYQQFGSVGRHQRCLGSDLRFRLQRSLGCNFFSCQRDDST